MAGRLTGKRALITGAGGLLGGDIARAFAAEGASLVLSTRSAAKLEPLAAELRAKGVAVACIGCDFTRGEEADALADAAWAALDGIDVVLFSSQPANPCQGALLELDDAVLFEQQQAIAWGPMRTMRRLAPKMIAAGRGGSIITLTSSTGSEPTPGYAAYGLAKAALWLATLHMAREWGVHGIRANVLQPGLVATDGDVARLEEIVRKQGMLSRTSLNRPGTNAEVVGAAIYLASDESRYTSAQRIACDGGRV